MTDRYYPAIGESDRVHTYICRVGLFKRFIGAVDNSKPRTGGGVDGLAATEAKQ